MKEKFFLFQMQLFQELEQVRTFYGTAMVRHFEMLDVLVLVGNLALTRSRDKLKKFTSTFKNDVDMPKQYLPLINQMQKMLLL